MKAKTFIIVLLALILAFGIFAYIVPPSSVHTVSGKTMTMDGTITGYYETKYTQFHGNDVIESFVSFKYMDAEQNVLIDLVSDDKMSIRSALLAEEVVGNESVYYEPKNYSSQSDEDYVREEYVFVDGVYVAYWRYGSIARQEYKYFYNGVEIIHEIADEGYFLFGGAVSPSDVVTIFVGGEKDAYNRTYNSTTGDIITTEYYVYDKDGLCLGTYVFDSENNKIEEKLTHYVKEYKNNGEATVTLYDYKGNELGTAKYSGGYCQ